MIAVRTGKNTFKVLDWENMRTQPEEPLVFKDPATLTDDEQEIMKGDAPPKGEGPRTARELAGEGGPLSGRTRDGTEGGGGYVEPREAEARSDRDVEDAVRERIRMTYEEGAGPDEPPVEEVAVRDREAEIPTQEAQEVLEDLTEGPSLGGAMEGAAMAAPPSAFQTEVAPSSPMPPGMLPPGIASPDMMAGYSAGMPPAMPGGGLPPGGLPPLSPEEMAALQIPQLNESPMMPPGVPWER